MNILLLSVKEEGNYMQSCDDQVYVALFYQYYNNFGACRMKQSLGTVTVLHENVYDRV